MKIDEGVLLSHWPHCPSGLLKGIATTSEEVLAKYEINTPLRLAHFLAQVSHESGAGTITVENLYYSTAARLMAVWPSRFPNKQFAEGYTHNPKKLASYVYSGRMGNRVGTDDGYEFRGRGILQITGRSEFEAIGKIAGLDLLGNPELASDNQQALNVAGAFWSSKPLNRAADKDDLRRVTELVNGGHVGLAEREKWLRLWKAELGV